MAQQFDVEDLSAYQALFEQFREENSAAETGALLSLNVQLDDDDDGDKVRPVERVPVGDFGDQGFLLRGFLSPAECQRLVAAAEASGGLTCLPGVKRQYRSCSRAVFHEPQLASRLFRRLAPHLPALMTVGEDPVASQHVFGPPWLLRGDWRPHCLNPVLRVCRYEPGQHFAPHFDGHLVHSDTNRSMQTFMLYLTDNPAGSGGGGATNFLAEAGLNMSELTSDATAGGRLSAPPGSVVCSVQPQAGAALVFNHYRLHEGEPLRCGLKFILRSDVMYERVVGPPATEAQRSGLRLLQEAERLESRGAADEAAALYRRAFRVCPELETCT